MDLAEAFGVLVRELRIEAGLTQEQLGFEAGQALADWLNRYRDIDAETLDALIQAQMSR